MISPAPQSPRCFSEQSVTARTGGPQCWLSLTLNALEVPLTRKIQPMGCFENSNTRCFGCKLYFSLPRWLRCSCRAGVQLPARAAFWEGCSFEVKRSCCFSLSGAGCENHSVGSGVRCAVTRLFISYLNFCKFSPGPLEPPQISLPIAGSRVELSKGCVTSLPSDPPVMSLVMALHPINFHILTKIVESRDGNWKES